MSDPLPLESALQIGEQFKEQLQASIDAKTKVVIATQQPAGKHPILPAADVYTPHGGIK